MSWELSDDLVQRGLKMNGVRYNGVALKFVPEGKPLPQLRT
jgi:hypothetical protein